VFETPAWIVVDVHHSRSSSKQDSMTCVRSQPHPSRESWRRITDIAYRAASCSASSPSSYALFVHASSPSQADSLTVPSSTSPDTKRLRPRALNLYRPSFPWLDSWCHLRLVHHRHLSEFPPTKAAEEKQRGLCAEGGGSLRGTEEEQLEEKEWRAWL
jgi:hypothetical protein